MNWDDLISGLFPDLPVAAIVAYVFTKTNEYWRRAIMSITSTYEARITELLDRHTRAIAQEKARAREREKDLITLVKMLLPKPPRKK